MLHDTTHSEGVCVAYLITTIPDGVAQFLFLGIVLKVFQDIAVASQKHRQLIQLAHCCAHY